MLTPSTCACASSESPTSRHAAPQPSSDTPLAALFTAGPAPSLKKELAMSPNPVEAVRSMDGLNASGCWVTSSPWAIRWYSSPSELSHLVGSVPRLSFELGKDQLDLLLDRDLSCSRRRTSWPWTTPRRRQARTRRHRTVVGDVPPHLGVVDRRLQRQTACPRASRRPRQARSSSPRASSCTRPGR